MKKFNQFIASTILMALCVGQVQGQPIENNVEYYDDCAPCVDETSAAYYDCGRASTMSAWIPLGALGIAAILIATTNRHHGHGGSSSSSSSSSSSHSHSHSHYGSNCY